jgi:hypothetical protein
MRTGGPDRRLEMRAKLLYASGSMALASGVLHCLFWVMFDWAEELPRLSAMNAAIMQVINIVCIFTMLFQGIASFILARKQGAFTWTEKLVVLFIGGFYFLRAAFGFPLFGFSVTEAVVVLICLVVFLLNILALRLPKGHERDR